MIYHLVIISKRWTNNQKWTFFAYNSKYARMTQNKLLYNGGFKFKIVFLRACKNFEI